LQTNERRIKERPMFDVYIPVSLVGDRGEEDLGSPEQSNC